MVVGELPSQQDSLLQMVKVHFGKTTPAEQSTAVIISDGDYLEAVVNSNDLTKILMAFLELLHELVQSALKPPMIDEHIQHTMNILSKVSDFLWLDNLPPVLVKQMLMILNSGFDHYFENQTRKDSYPVQKVDAHEIVRKVQNGWLNRLCYRDVQLGFGGINIMKSGGENLDEFCNGDYPLLRQLVQLIISGAVKLLGNAHSKGRRC